MSVTEKHILIVDDDKDIRDLLGEFLVQHGFIASTAANGQEMFKQLKQSLPNLIILDVMMPGDDGLELCRKLRSTSKIPIIMLTAVSEETDRIVGLELGADDYISKPFNPRELLARIKAIFRRTDNNSVNHTTKVGIYRFADWQLDTNTRVLISPTEIHVDLTTGEYDLLLALLEHARHVLSRDQLLDITRHREAGPFDRSIDVQISRLRQKIEKDPKNPTMIKTIRGGGYMLTTEVEKV